MLVEYINMLVVKDIQEGLMLSSFTQVPSALSQILEVHEQRVPLSILGLAWVEWAFVKQILSHVGFDVVLP
jgi:hypothetical protein